MEESSQGVCDWSALGSSGEGLVGDADGDLHPDGDGADGLPAPVAVEERGAFVVDDGSAATDLAFPR
jgi:hypothetical protein